MSFDFKIGSLNIRGINNHSKRISVFNWIKSKQFDIMLLQETFSSKSEENLWQTEWGGPVFWSHGTKHSCGVCVLVRKGFDFKVEELVIDPHGRYIILSAIIQGENMYIINVYAPNTKAEQSIFFNDFQVKIARANIDKNDFTIIGGDWNTILSPPIDKSGGQNLGGESITLEMKSLLLNLNLNDIWRIKNPYTHRYTFRQRKPLIQSRLDYFLVSHCAMDVIADAKILASYCSDHSCISLHLVS